MTNSEARKRTAEALARMREERTGEVCANCVRLERAKLSREREIERLTKQLNDTEALLLAADLDARRLRASRPPGMDSHEWLGMAR